MTAKEERAREEERVRREEEDKRCAREAMEEDRRRGAEERAHKDQEIARRMQEELERASNGGGAGSKGSSPILDAWRRASARRPDGAGGGVAEGRWRNSKSVSVASAPSSVAALPEGVGSGDLSQSPVATTTLEGATGPATPTDAASIKERAIREVVVMEFGEPSARRCLKDVDGNVQLAVSMLLSEASDR